MICRHVTFVPCVLISQKATLSLIVVWLHLICIIPHFLQEEIKITSVTVFVNPYTEPDEEDKKGEDEKKDDDEENVSFHFLHLQHILAYSALQAMDD